MDLRGFLMYHKKNAGGLVITDAGRSLTDEELRAYCIWGLQNGYKTLYELPEFETIEVELKLIEKYVSKSNSNLSCPDDSAK